MRVDQTSSEDNVTSSETLIKRAEAAVAALRGQFTEWAQKDIASIDAHFRDVCAEGDMETRGQSLEKIRQIAHNIKGQGGTFGFAALSDAAAALDAFIKSGKAAHDLEQTRAAIAGLHSAFRSGSV
jgi:HPt (histidine-containing phosphotransfer) domain-containing protein